MFWSNLSIPFTSLEFFPNPHHYSLSILRALFLSNSLSSLSAFYVLTDGGPSTGPWVSAQGQQPYGKLTHWRLPEKPSVARLGELDPGGTSWELSYPRWGFDCFILVWILYTQSQPPWAHVGQILSHCRCPLPLALKMLCANSGSFLKYIHVHLWMELPYQRGVNKERNESPKHHKLSDKKSSARHLLPLSELWVSGVT